MQYTHILLQPPTPAARHTAGGLAGRPAEGLLISSGAESLGVLHGAWF